MGLSKAQLLAELTECNEFFDVLVDMFPAQLYIAPRKLEQDDQDEEEAVGNTKYFRNPSRSNADTKEARRAAAKAAKRRKLDPATVETTSQLQHKLSGTSGSASAAGGGSTLLPKAVATTTSTTTTGTTTNSSSTSAASWNKSRIEVLREKLHAKIAEKQALNPRPANPQQVSKRAARRAEKERRRAEAIAKKRKAAASATTDTTTKSYHLSNTAEANISPADDLAHVDFGRLSGLNASMSKTGSTTKKSAQKNYEQSNKALQNLSKSKNLHKMLADAEAKHKKLQQLKQGTAAEQAQAQQMMWSDTFKEADGQRIKDDPTKLKKTLKRKAAKKAKSQKAWQSRTAQMDQKKQERQAIRQHNLQARKQGGQVGANLSRKEIRSTEPGGEDQGRRLYRAGFEGRKREFLNGDKIGSKPQNQ